MAPDATLREPIAQRRFGSFFDILMLSLGPALSVRFRDARRELGREKKLAMLGMASCITCSALPYILAAGSGKSSFAGAAAVAKEVGKEEHAAGGLRPRQRAAALADRAAARRRPLWLAAGGVVRRVAGRTGEHDFGAAKSVGPRHSRGCGCGDE